MTSSSTPADACAVRPVSFSDMEQVFDGLSDGILIIRADRSIAYANPAFARLWRVPGELMDFRNDFALVNHVLSQLAEPTRFIHEVERLYLSQAPSLDELAFKDGRLFRRRSVAVESPGAQPARVWIFTDISDTQPSRLNSLPAKRPGLFSGLFKG